MRGARPGRDTAGGHKDPRQAVLSQYLVLHGLKASRQREVIAGVFFRCGGHISVEELLRKVRDIEPRVSQATVYRTMKLLHQSGLAEERRFNDGFLRYEPKDVNAAHHDHLICTGCGKIIEFVSDEIESLQDRVAKAHDFSVTHHRMELYGLCALCR